jgi:transposase InsO family protein
MKIFLLAIEAAGKSGATQIAIILNCGGVQVQEICEHFVYGEDEDKNDPDTVLAKIRQYCNPRSSEVYDTYCFWCTQWCEPFDTFLTEIRTKVELCDFGDLKERMIRDKIVFTVGEKLKEKLLQKEKLTLKAAIDTCRAHEITKKQAQDMTEGSGAINKVYSNGGRGRRKQGNQNSNTSSGGACAYCGYSHPPRKCPAWGKTCDNCGKTNHFKSVCKSVKFIEKDEITDDAQPQQAQESLSNNGWLNQITINQVTSKSKETALMMVNGCKVHFQLDTGAEINTICQRFVKKGQVTPTNTTLTMWNKSTLAPLGVAKLNTTNPKNDEACQVQYIVVPNSYTSLFGLKTIQDMGLFTIHREKFIAQVETSIALGDLGSAKLYINAEAKPRVLPCRRIPFAIQDDVKVELDKLVDRGVLIPIEKPSEWVSQMAVVRKSNGKLRICIDPQPLNEALQRQHYKLSTLDDVLPMLNNSRVFSKLDVKEAFWHVKLDYDSSMLTAMITPFGRFRWARLPFGLCVSSEVFQKKLQDAIEGLRGVICVADDLVVVGCGKNDEEADKDHELNLEALKKRCIAKNIRLNDAKSVLKQREIKFMGHSITSAGIKPDEDKVSAIRKMPPPTDVEGVRRLCGMIQYLAKFLPNLSADIEPIRALTKKDVEWKWGTEQVEALETVKQKVADAPVLAYFDTDEPLVLQVDSSKDGLGAAMLQNGQPVEFASRALSKSERNWAQIEKETLAVVYGLERFDQYTYGRRVKVQNDHKPLQHILKKPLAQVPKRLQSLLMRMHRYDVEFQYLPGKNLVIADTLSRAYLDVADEKVMVVELTDASDISDRRLQEIKEATASDNSMQLLLEIIREGWPKDKTQVPAEISSYFELRDVLSYQEGLVLKGEQIVIPRGLRELVKHKLHTAHLGYDSMLRRARDTVFWPGMKNEIKQIANACDVCQEMKPNVRKETLVQHDEPQKPWSKVGVDIFEIAGRSYLVCVDYFSNYIEADFLSSITSAAVILKLKGHFARYGIPTIVMSDGGAQFTSKEFAQFADNWGFQHNTSSPNHQQSNGKAEAAVKIMKTMMIKAMKSGSDQYGALLELRNTPRQDTLLSPAQMMFGRATRGLVPCVCVERSPDTIQARKRRETRRRSVKNHYDKSAKNRPPLKRGQAVFYKRNNKQVWRKGKVVEDINQRSYRVQDNDGGTYRRNKLFIRTDPRPQMSTDPMTLSKEDLPTNTGGAAETEDVHVPGEEPQAHDTPENQAPPSWPTSMQPDTCREPRPQRARQQPAWLKDYTV